MTVVTRERVPQDGHYSYLKHVVHDMDCPVRPAARWSVYLAMGVQAPRMAMCRHDVHWVLDPPPPVDPGRVTVETGKQVDRSGHYSYLEHVKDGAGCKVHPAAKRGMYLAWGSLAPGLVTCGHKVRWKLDLPPGSDS